MRASRLTTKSERNTIARRIKSRLDAFGKSSSEKFARESTARLNKWAGGLNRCIG